MSMRIDYTKELYNLYPTGEAYKKLLPNGDPFFQCPPYDIRGNMNLREYGLVCQGCIGFGGYATVYAAVDREGKQYACKVVDLGRSAPNGENMLRVLEKTLSEIVLQKELMAKGTPGIIPLVYYSPSIEKIQAMIQTLRAGKSISGRFRKAPRIIQQTPLLVPYERFLDQLYLSGRKLTIEQAAALLLDLAEAIQRIQDAHVLHRDIKPSNLYLGVEHGKIRVLIGDFNASKMLEDKGNKDLTLTIAGTENYMAPWIARGADRNGNGHISFQEAMKLDVYSFACVGYMMFNSGQMLHRDSSGRLPLPKHAPTPEFGAFLVNLLEVVPEREKKMSEVIETLYRFYRFGSNTAGNSRKPKDTPPPAPRKAMHPQKPKPKQKNHWIYI